MKQVYLLALFAWFGSYVYAQKTAITEEGKVVLLFDNGTWSYMNDSVFVSRDELLSCPTPGDADTHVFGKTLPYRFFYNSEKWEILPDTVYKQADYAFRGRRRDIIGMVIADRLSMPLTVIRSKTLDNFRKAGVEFRIAEERSLLVNGKEGLLMKIDALVDQIPYAYLNVYISDPSGTYQIMTYTGYNLFDQNRKEMMDFICGFALSGR